MAIKTDPDNSLEKMDLIRKGEKKELHTSLRPRKQSYISENKPPNRENGSFQPDPDLLHSLFQISNKLSESYDPDSIMTMLGEELRSHNLDCMIILIDEDTNDTYVQNHTIAQKSLFTAERITNSKLSSIKRPLSDWPRNIQLVFTSGTQLFIENMNAVIAEFIPLPKQINKLALSSIGVTADTHGAFLPLQNQERIFGCLSIWGKTLNESEMKTYMLFASQIASTMEHARLLRLSDQKNKLLSRSSSLVRSLNYVSVQISSTQNIDAVFNILGEELEKLGLHCLIVLLDDDDEAVSIRYVSYSFDEVNRIQSLIKSKIIGHKIPLSSKTEVIRKSLEQNEPLFLQNLSDVAKQAFPHLTKAVIQKILLSVGITEDTAAVTMSIDYQNSTYGSLFIWGESLREEDFPAFKVFANQVANVIEYVELLNISQEENQMRKKVQEKLEKSRKELREIFELAHDAILLIDPENNSVIDVNDRASEIYGFARDAFRGMDLEVLNPDMRNMERLIDRTMTDGTCNGYKIIHYRKDGQEIKLEINSSVIEYGEKPTIQCISRDITERDKYENMLKHAANHDALTNLPNRVMFKNRLEYAIKRAKRYQEVGFAVLYMDLDNFKRINDSLGHPVGDQYLIEFSKIIKSIIRETDIAARLGGDEFAILLEDTHKQEDAEQFCSRLLQAMSEPIHINSQDFVISASIGIVMSSSETTSADAYLRNADIAMYQAKRKGRKRYSFFRKGMHTGLLQKVNLETRMRKALEHNEFFLEYQPIINVSKNTIQGYEALVRWQTPDSGVIPPASFIPIAEETGLIHELGKWVLKEACKQIQDWKYQNMIPIESEISVNVSAVQLSRPKFPDEILEILNSTGLKPEYLSIEITESAFITDPFVTETTLQGIRDLNINIHLDDFGTGYSSLSFLAKFPINAIKIDKRFVMEMGEGKNLALVKSMLVLSQALGIEIIAEGVETQSQLQALINMGCQNMQGFYFSKPLGAASVTNFSYPLPPNSAVANS